MKPLNTISEHYPSFQPNQVLTSKHLNDLADYLEQQERLTRHRLLGMGIACGLEVSLKTSGVNATVIVSRGTGVTSEGLLATRETTLCTHVKINYKDPSGYLPFIDPLTSKPYTFYEIFPDPGVTDDPNVVKLTTSHTSDKIVVLFLELLEENAAKCLDENCDEKGKNWKIRQRILLIDRKVMMDILESIHKFGAAHKDENYVQQLFFRQYFLESLYLENFAYTDTAGDLSTDLSKVVFFEDYLRGYSLYPIARGSIRIANAVHALWSGFKPLFDLQSGSLSNPFSGWEHTNSSNTLYVKCESQVNGLPISVQYVYDWLADIRDTYHELRDCLLQLQMNRCPDESAPLLTSDCCQNSTHFPRHLMLGHLALNAPIGQFEAEDYPPSIWRHHYRYSAIMDGQGELLLRIKQLIQRLLLIKDRFSLSGRITGKTNVVINPDQPCSEPLGNRSIPFYYDPVSASGKNLYQYWSFEKTTAALARQTYSYGSAAYVSGDGKIGEKQQWIVKPLPYEFCNAPKLRIEGHVGRPVAEVADELIDQRKKYNLAFDIVALKLDSIPSDVFVAEHESYSDIQAHWNTERNHYICGLNGFRDFMTRNPFGKYWNTAAYFLLYLKVSNPAKYLTIMAKDFDYLKTSMDILETHLYADVSLVNFSNLEKTFQQMIYFADRWLFWVDIFLLADPAAVAGSQSENYKFLFWLQDIRRYLVSLLEICILDKLRTIFTMFGRRIRRTTLFSDFNKTIHGMQHIAGTMRGGTFILVYADQRKFKTVSGVITDAAGNPKEGVEIMYDYGDKIYRPAGFTDKEGKYMINIPEETMQLKMDIGGFEEKSYKMMAGANDYVYEGKIPDNRYVFAEGIEIDFIRDWINDVDPYTELEKLLDKITEATAPVSPKINPDFNLNGNFNYVVVGDFWLPYRISQLDLDKEVIDFKRKVYSPSGGPAFYDPTPDYKYIDVYPKGELLYDPGKVFYDPGLDVEKEINIGKLIVFDKTHIPEYKGGILDVNAYGGLTKEEYELRMKEASGGFTENTPGA